MSLRSRITKLERMVGARNRRSIREYSDAELEAIILEESDEVSDETLERIASSRRGSLVRDKTCQTSALLRRPEGYSMQT